MKQTPDFVFEDSLTVIDSKRCIALPFDVPAGTAELRIAFDWTQPEEGRQRHVKSAISLGLYDPEGFRGNKHNGKCSLPVEIGPRSATPGFRPGPLPAGRWTLEVQTHAVVPGAPLEYRAEVVLTPGEKVAAAARAFPWQGVLRTGAGWYRGDLHTHTVNSDGSDTVESLLGRAQAHGLDFLALTDHNSIEGLFDPVLNGYRGLLVIPGMELTTFFGHALALGVTQWIDWRAMVRRWTMAEALAQIHALGGLSVVAHLAAMGDPICTGCAWLYTDQMPGMARAMEVWNGPWLDMMSNNPVTLRVYYDWLRLGHRVPATAGSDSHNPREDWTQSACNIVYARGLSAAAILEGVAAGHVMISNGPRLYLEAALADGRTAMMGDAVAADAVRALTVRTPDAPAGSRVRWLVDGEVAATWGAEVGVASPGLPFGARWVSAELRAADGGMLALTNPIYLDGAA